MKNIILFILLLMSLSIQLLAQKLVVAPPRQPFEQIKFQNFEPQWWYDLYDSTLARNDTFTGYNNSFDFTRILTGKHSHEGRFYRCHLIREYDYMGFIVNSIDIASGEILWSKLIDTSLFSTQLCPIYQNFDSDGNLVIYGFRRKSGYNPRENSWFHSYPSKIFKIVLDKRDGNIISSHSPDSNVDINFSAWDHNKDLDVSNFGSKGEIEFLLRREYFPILSYKVFKGIVDSLGTMSILDSLEYSPPRSQILRSRYAVKENKFYCLEQKKIENTVQLLELDNDLNIVNEIEITFLEKNLGFGELTSFTDDYIFFIQVYTKNDALNYRIYIYDYKGNLLNLYEINDKFLSRFNETRFEYDEKEQKLLAFGLNIEQNFQSKETTGFMHIIYYDGQTFETKKIIEVANKNRDYFPNFTFFDGEDHLIMDGRIGLVFYDDTGVVPRFRRSQRDWSHCILRVSRKELGLETSSTSELDHQKHFIIYPNPTTSLVTIEGLTEAATVDIYNLQGTKMGSHRVDENNIIDIDHIPAGMYILDIQTKHRKERHKIIKMD